MAALKRTTIDEHTKTCGLIGCGLSFEPRKKWQEYCTKEHKDMAYFIRMVNKYMKSIREK